MVTTSTQGHDAPATEQPPDSEGDIPGRRGGGVAFLLTQLGTHAAGRFAQRIAALDLTPPQAGLLRAIGERGGSSQQELATRLGLLPSRVVGFIDNFEQRGLVRRQRSSTDRRQYALELTDDGRAVLAELGQLARGHECDITATLSDDERRQLGTLLTRIAAAQGLTPGVHPGYRQLRDTPDCS